MTELATESLSKSVLINRAIAECSTLKETITQVVKGYSSNGGFDFQSLIEQSYLLRSTSYAIGNLQLYEIANELALLLTRESIRSRMGLRTAERTSQLFSFFTALFLRVGSMLQALMHSIDNGKSDSQNLFILNKDRKRRVVIIDDSKTFQMILQKILGSHPNLEVVGIAGDAEEGEKLIEALHPDVATLDVHMPGVDGFTFLSRLMKKYPIPVVMISSLNVESGGDVFDALYQGAIDFIRKSNVTLNEKDSTETMKRVYRASLCNLGSLMRFYIDAPSLLDPPVLSQTKVIAIGAAMGSTRTLIDILRQLPKNIPPILICQRIVPGFSKLLIQRLNEVYPFTVKEAEHGELVEPMKVLIAPEGTNMSVLPSNQGYRINLTEAGEITEKPSVDVLFDSVAICYGSEAVGVLLPSSGTDGAQGLLEIRRAGGYTIVQDELDCPDPSVTREAVRIEAAQVSAWGDHVSEVLLDAVTKGSALRSKPVIKGTILEGDGPRILVVDDSPTIRALVRHNLRAVGFSNFFEAKDGLAAWKVLVSGVNENLPFSIVICDQNMPEMKGLELLQKIRSHEVLKALPFILVTSASDRETVMKAIQGKISDFVTKPMSAQILAEKVQALIGPGYGGERTQ